MREITYVFNKVFTKTYYKENAGFFLIVIMICFGFMRDAEHKALAEFFISSPATLSTPIAAWIGYCFKVVHFNNGTLQAKENEFLYHAREFSKPLLLTASLSIAINQCLPFLLYAAFLTITAVKHKQQLSVSIIFACSLVLVFLVVIFFQKSLNTPGKQKSESRLIKYFNSKLRRPLVLFFPEWLLRNELSMFLGSKLFACTIIFGTIQLYHAEQYDWRLLCMATLFAMTGNSVLIYKYFLFDEVHLSISRNLPQTLLTRLNNFLLTFVLLCGVEFGFLIRNFPGYLPNVTMFSLLLYAMGVLLFLYSILYWRNIPIDRFVLLALVFSLIMFVTILFKVSVLVITIVLTASATTVFIKRYYLFEFTDNEKEPI